MLTEEAHSIIAAADATNEEAAALRLLRELSVDQFGELLIDPSLYPFLAAILPKMPPANVQKSWTGAEGMDLLRNGTAPFIRCVEESYCAARHAALRDVSALDYGCGWGRNTRMLLKYTDPHRIWALDPLEVSLQFCRDAGVRANLRRSDPIPKKLPVTEPIDLCIAYSVFTHTSARATRQSLQAIHDISAPNAVLVFTIRPVEFWGLRKAPEFADQHRETGFAFQGDGRILYEGEDTYGHASMSQEYAAQLMEETGWSLFRFDHTLSDEYQTRVVGIRQ